LSNHLVLNTSSQSRPPQSKPVHIHIARLASTILSPIAVSLPSVILVALYHAANIALALFYACIVLLFLSIGPMIYIVIGVRMGKFTDTDVSVRSQRVAPFLFGLSSSILGLLILFLTHGPKNLITVLLLASISGILMMVITFWWKISLHAASLASSVTLLTILYGTIILPAFLLVALVGWSRVVLHRHTVGQVIAGATVNILLVVVVVQLRGI